ncbi:helix-turn-helix domain-containing protein [Hwanghaeella grinnelliae]|uniref:Helix-turn-helix domain-containing protein n=1 Tax=Hwanghaeella grinnelliae TaxID=2500179 RepID=A0A3S2W7I2_9PROT|nr:helix-turn-helix transcriptional regulator [Hwanghaeella grinnelliae]RVU39174.1 helix-turn-helix domain-containing protein [Hwanghaeella grinnelliae]
MKTGSITAGELLRDWRQRRRLSQLALAADADISQRHLSFMESGRSKPSRDMVLRLTGHLDVPLRDRNAILTAAGYAPHYPQHPLDAPELSMARETVERILHGHMPHPALAVDRHWTLLAGNDAVTAMLAGVAPHLLEGEVNALRVSLHPDGLAPRILNIHEWRGHILHRLSHDIEKCADPVLVALYDELKSYPVPGQAGPMRTDPAQEGRIAVPLRLKGESSPLSFLSTTTVFGTAVDVTLSEVTIEAFFPADEDTAHAMAALAGRP